MQEAEIKHYMRLALRAISEVHEKGIIHRDIKPQNLLYDQSTKQLTLIDFGMSYNDASSKFWDVGCRFFRAPEILFGKEDYDTKADIWSMGMIFASLIFKQFPFVGAADTEGQAAAVAKLIGQEELT